jgi:hypothetical protein
MERLQFSTVIDAPAHSVWAVLWGEDSYPKWTKAFSEDSHADTDWQEGSKVIFGDGKGNGMFSRIERRIDEQLMDIHHLGVMKNGIEQPANEESEKWANAHEIYKLKEEAGQTTLTAEMDTIEEYKDYFAETFPKALELVKTLSES